MSRAGQLGQVRTQQPASGYIGMYPCYQLSPDSTVLDQSGQGNHATLGTLTAAEAWAAAPNGLTSLDATGKFAAVPAAAFNAWQPGMSLIIAMAPTLNKKVSTAAFAGNGAGGGASGIGLRCTATGQAQFVVYDTGGTVVGSPGATTETPWASAVNARVMFAIDGPSGKLLIFVNGLRASNYLTAQNVSAYIGNAGVAPTAPFGLGGRAAADRMAGVISGAHLYATSAPIFDSSVDLYAGQIDALAAFHNRAPAALWSDRMVL